MKKRFISILFAMGVLFSPLSPLPTNTATAAEQKATCQVDSVFYDPGYKAYYLYASDTKESGDFVIYLFDRATEDQNLTRNLNGIFEHQAIEVTYEDNDTPANIDDDIIFNFEMK